MIYYDDGALRIRTMTKGDIAPFVAAFASQGWGGKGEELFHHYLAQQEEGVRALLTAELDGEAAGYVTLCKQAEDGPFRGKNIPEIKDFNVLQKFQRRGIGARLMDAVEALAAKGCDRVCLGVGLYSGYGPAQRMYTKRGYVFDGSGVWYGEETEPVPAGESRPVDDDLNLYLVKKLT
ncbi:MAG: GNAT family N-acetyltransferase [Oscillospiraceae bacterium]